MSWSFTHVGTRQAVADKIAKENYVPESLKKALAEVVLTPTAPHASNGVKVTSHGHVDSASASAKIEIESVALVLDPIASPPVAPPGT